MALSQDLPVFADVYTLTHKVFLFTQDYPREYKFTLGQDMKRDCLVLLRSIRTVNPPALPSKVQILHPPPVSIASESFTKAPL